MKKTGNFFLAGLFLTYLREIRVLCGNLFWEFIGFL